MNPFEPECLTIGLGSGCNLDCQYCYGKSGLEAAPAPSEPRAFLDAVAAAAELVAETSVRAGRRLVFGYQGMGEPFLDFEFLKQTDEIVREIAAQRRLATFSYITSNGTMSADRYRWAAQRFDRLCLSLDGPPGIHDLARRDRSGNSTSHRVLRTVELLRTMGKLPVCRVTVTRENAASMVDVADYLLVELGLAEVQFEPVFRHADLCPEAEEFVHGLLGAREIANRCGGEVVYSGYRSNEVHGRYCQTSRRVLFVTRNGSASACLWRESEPEDSPFVIGTYGGGRLVIDQSRIEAFEAMIARLPEVCSTCEVRHHCTRGCPDRCPLDSVSAKQDVDTSLGCRINRLLHAAQARAELPDMLLAAQCELREQGRVVSNLDEHLAHWQCYLGELRTRVPSVHVVDNGATVCLGEVSPGCAHCKRGNWDCIFVTRRCNLACSFCCSPKDHRSKGVTSALGRSVEQMVENYLSLGIRGVSLSGGESFLEPELVFSLLETLRSRLQDRYLWLYTNGLLLLPEHIDRLAALGLDEIRFNTAASGYRDPIVLRTIARAASRIPAVTVEIPAIPDDAPKLIDCLSAWSNAGVKYLNLHELMREPASASARLKGEFRQVVLPDGHVTDVSVSSRAVVLQVMQTVAEKQIPLHVNFCSFTNKILQLCGRRGNLAALRRQPHERLVDRVYLDTVLACSSREAYEFVAPDEIARLHADGRGRRFFLIRRTAPLSLDDPGRLVEVEEVTP